MINITHQYLVNPEDLVVLPNFNRRLFEKRTQKNWIAVLPKKKIIIPPSWVCMKSYHVTIKKIFSAVLSHFSVTRKF